MHEGQDYFATELLHTLKIQLKSLVIVAIVLIVLCAAIVAGFLWYLNQYDFSSTSTYEATGYNALIDSSGNVIASDIPDELIEEIMNYGDGTSNQD